MAKIGVITFANKAQALLVDYLRENYGDACADWCRDFWTGKRGRLCLAHARYAGSNNNMCVEVSWRSIKKLCSAGCTLAYFLSMLCKFICNVLGEEHMQRLVDAGTPNAFINDPQPTKETYDAVQDMHPKTRSVCFVLETSTRLKNPLIVYRDLMEVVMESGAPNGWANAALNLKIVAMHEDRISEGVEDTII